MFNVKELLSELKASPYKYLEIRATHTGVVDFADIKMGDKVQGASGTWKEKKGTLLATLTRESNKKSICAPEKSEITEISTHLQGQFVEAGELLLVLRHYLSKDEVIEQILKKALSLFYAPERAKYYFIPEIDTKLKLGGKRHVQVKDGMDMFIMSRMKREVNLPYGGPDGVVYAVYFSRGDNVDVGQPLIGVCAEDQISIIEDVISKVKSEWEEID